MKKPILLFALKCTAIVYFVAFVNVKSFTTAANVVPPASTVENESIKQMIVDTKTTDPVNDKLYLTRL